MRKLTLILNAIVVVFFVLFLAYTFAAKSHIENLARDFVTEKTTAYANPTVAVAEESLESPLIRKLLSEEQINAIRTEIDNFKDNPSAYVSKLTGQGSQDLIPPNANPLVNKIASLKSRIRMYYDGTLNSLINDLRIFSVSNLLAGLVAIVLAYCSGPSVRKSLVWFSILMFVAVLYCSYMYIDGLSFFRILFRTHMGWWYAIVLLLTVASLYWDFGRHIEKTDSTPPSNGPKEKAAQIA
jgi:hypothetical protein